MGYPTSKVHRRSRRNLGRGQHTQLPAAAVVLTPSTSTVVLVFDQPMIVFGDIDLNLTKSPGPPPTLSSQVVVSPTQVNQTYSGTVVGCGFTISGINVRARTLQGGGVAEQSGIF